MIPLPRKKGTNGILESVETLSALGTALCVSLSQVQPWNAIMIEVAQQQFFFRPTPLGFRQVVQHTVVYVAS